MEGVRDGGRQRRNEGATEREREEREREREREQKRL